jgi:hypothetical protein
LTKLVAISQSIHKMEYSYADFELLVISLYNERREVKVAAERLADVPYDCLKRVMNKAAKISFGDKPTSEEAAKAQASFKRKLQAEWKKVCEAPPEAEPLIVEVVDSTEQQQPEEPVVVEATPVEDVETKEEEKVVPPPPPPSPVQPKQSFAKSEEVCIVDARELAALFVEKAWLSGFLRGATWVGAIFTVLITLFILFGRKMP